VKNLYDLLAVEPSADADAIRKAFLRQIALYHPDKVLHLGREFQELAEVRAAELTAAYRTLTHTDTRVKYDAALASAGPADAPPSPIEVEAAPVPAEAPRDEIQPELHAAPESGGFEKERTGRDDIMRRASLTPVIDAIRIVMGDCALSTAPGFELVCIPRGDRRMPMSLGGGDRRLPLLVRVAPLVDAAVITEAWRHAVRLRIEPSTQAIALLLLGERIASARDLAQGIERAKYMSPTRRDSISTVAVQFSEWNVHFPSDTPSSVRRLVDRLGVVVRASR